MDGLAANHTWTGYYSGLLGSSADTRREARSRRYSERNRENNEGVADLGPSPGEKQLCGRRRLYHWRHSPRGVGLPMVSTADPAPQTGKSEHLVRASLPASAFSSPHHDSDDLSFLTSQPLFPSTSRRAAARMRSTSGTIASTKLGLCGGGKGWAPTRRTGPLSSEKRLS